MSARAFTFNKRRNGIVTTYTDGIGFFQVVLHSTTVFSKYHDGSMQINSGGWRTATTKTAINRAFELLNIDARLYQVDFKWFLRYDNLRLEFEDNMTFGGSVGEIIRKLGITQVKEFYD